MGYGREHGVDALKTVISMMHVRPINLSTDSTDPLADVDFHELHPEDQRIARAEEAKYRRELAEGVRRERAALGLGTMPNGAFLPGVEDNSEAGRSQSRSARQMQAVRDWKAAHPGETTMHAYLACAAADPALFDDNPLPGVRPL